MRNWRPRVCFFASIAAVLVASIGATAAFLMAAAPKTQEEIPGPPPAMRSLPSAPRYVGAGSCAARACHGNPNLTPGQEWNSSYAVWVENDPHARAYNVLFTPESKNMAAALNLGEPWKADRCLACHSMPVSGSRAAERGATLPRCYPMESVAKCAMARRKIIWSPIRFAIGCRK